jgi:DNA polymerase elongation subunit (family B)
VSPKQIGGRFPEIYRSWYDRRLIAKRDGVKDVAEGLKTFLNGTFGKLSEPHSMFYSPPDFIQVTLTGQIALLMLIRDLSQMGIRVVSANTDGIVVYCHRTMLWLRDEVIAAWERRTGLTMEMTRYRSIHSRDVNNYIAIKSDGGVKLKGDYAPPVPVGTSWPSPSANVCVDAVVAHITRGDDVARTICATSDVRGFLFAQKVAGGAVWQGEHLGRVARWYWSTNGHTINYITNGNKVPLSDGAVPMMELADSIPDDVDVGRYIQRAERILQEIGYGKLEAEI